MISSNSIPHIHSNLAGFVNAGDWDAYMALVVPVRITNSDSPYTLDNTERRVIADTDGGAITINLPATPDHGYKIKNAGSSGNNITLSSSDSIEDSTVYDGESADLEFDSTEGWLWT